MTTRSRWAQSPSDDEREGEKKRSGSSSRHDRHRSSRHRESRRAHENPDDRDDREQEGDRHRHRHQRRRERERDGEREREREYRSARPESPVGSSRRSPSLRDRPGRAVSARCRSSSPRAHRTQSRSRSPVSERRRLGSGEGGIVPTLTSGEEERGPNFERSGLLAAESNNVDGVALKYHEPPEARRPKREWRLYTFKGGKELDMRLLSNQSCHLLGRDRTVVDVPLDHPSCSKQHAAIQFRLVVERNEFGDEKRSVRPFIIDLESANKTEVNHSPVPPSRYYELKSGDVITFGASTREYVLLAG